MEPRLALTPQIGADLGGTKLTELFPLPYAHWYAATLFAEAGYAASQIFERLNIDPARWQRFQERYSQLHYANTNWVAAAFRRDGLPEPEQDRALFQRLTGNDGIGLSVTEPFSMRTELAALRRSVEANPVSAPSPMSTGSRITSEKDDSLPSAISTMAIRSMWTAHQSATARASRCPG